MLSLRLKQTLFFAFVSLNFFSAYAQQYETGATEEDSGYAKASLIALPSSKADLPRNIDLRPYCPTPRHQGKVGSCVGWALGYGLMTIEKAIQNNETNTKKITENAFSALFIYNQIRSQEGTCLSASVMSDAVAFLQENGNCLASEFDFKTDDCYVKPNEKLKTQAKQNVISGFNRLFDEKDDIQKKVNIIRKVLSLKKPVAINIKINKNFESLTGAEYWYPRLGKDPDVSHAMVIVGYDDDAGCFTLLNSWGKAWGDDGFIKVKYRDLGECCRFAFVIYFPKNNSVSEPLVMTTAGLKRESSVRPNPEKKQIEPEKPLPPQNSNEAAGSETSQELVEMGGKIEVNYYTQRATDMGEPIFETVGIEQKGYHYDLLKKDWRVGDFFQLSLISEINSAYIYILSVNPRNEVKIMYPRHEDFGKRYKGFFESPHLMLDGARILLPSPTKGIKVDYAGTDRICILFSIRKIKNFEILCELMAHWKGDFDDYFQQQLGEAIIPMSDISFSRNKIAFSVATRSLGSIVPIVIQFKSSEK